MIEMNAFAWTLAIFFTTVCALVIWVKYLNLDILPPPKHPKGIKSGIPVSHLTGFLFHRSLLREQAWFSRKSPSLGAFTMANQRGRLAPCSPSLTRTPQA